MEMLMNNNEEVRNIVILSDNTTTENSMTVGIKNISCNQEEYEIQIDLLKQIIDEKDKRIKKLEDLVELLKKTASRVGCAMRTKCSHHLYFVDIWCARRTLHFQAA